MPADQQKSAPSNPCIFISGMPVPIDPDHCHCPEHGIFKESHLIHSDGKVVFKQGKGYREGACLKCRRE